MLDRRAHGAEGGGMIAEGDPRKLLLRAKRTKNPVVRAFFHRKVLAEAAA